MDSTFTLQLNKTEVMLLAQCCGLGIERALKDKEEPPPAAMSLDDDGKQSYRDYFDRRINKINALHYNLQQHLAAPEPAHELNGKPFEDLTTSFKR